MIDWQAYERCPVCFRAYDCRMLRRGQSRSLRHIGAVYDAEWKIIRYTMFRLEAVPAGWYDRSLRRPHPGRRRRET